MRRLLLSVLVAVALLGLGWLSPPSAAERAAWLADLDLLERHTALAYANLGDRLASRSLSPRVLDATARAALLEARSRSAARRALERFVEAFDDWHFRARAPYGALRRLVRRLAGKDQASEGGPWSRTASGDEACARLGATDRRGGKLDWRSLPGFEPLDLDPATHPFPSGVLRRAGRPPLALLRIGLFSESAYPQLCAAEWERARATLPTDPTVPTVPAEPAEPAECNEACRDAFSSRLERALLERLAAQLDELARLGATTLLVDLTDNGGGSGIVGPMARMVSSRPLPQRSFGFIRHPHSVARLRATAGDFRQELERADLTARQRAIVATALARAEAATREAETPCDLSDLWQLDAGATLPCENIGRSAPWLEHAEPGELDGLESRGHLGGSDLPLREGVWRGELFVLANRWTASASEDFAASLQDAGAARIVGERTLGVGCGYTNGGVTLELPATGLTVRAPDCVRYRADGRNEADGVLPDLPVPWSDGDDAHQRAARAIAALPL